MDLIILGLLSQIIRELIAENYTVVMGAGNSGVDACGIYPTNTPGVVVVGGINDHLQVPTFSNYGPCVTLFAPAQEILTTHLNGEVLFITGTSVAAPIVAGVLALLRSELPQGNITEELLNRTRNGLLLSVRGQSPNRLVSVLPASCATFFFIPSLNFFFVFLINFLNYFFL